MGDRFDVAVVGAGPAGASVARLCAALGHRVVLVHAEAKARGPEVESLPPSALPLLESMDLSEVVHSVAVGPMTGTVVRWADDAVREATFETPGLQVSRSRLDPALRFAAVSAGASLREMRVRSADLLTDLFEIDCEVVVDATGRFGPLMTTLREAPRGWRTLAIVGVFGGVRPWGADGTRGPSRSIADGHGPSPPVSARGRSRS